MTTDNKSELRDQARSIAATVLSKSIADLSDDVFIFEVGDALDWISVLMAWEEAVGVAFDDDDHDFRTLTTVGALLTLLETRKGVAHG